jgi:hypothetical protein
MKEFLLAAALFLSIGAAEAHAPKCEIKLQDIGVYNVYCPSGSFVTATATNGNIVGNPRFPQLNLRTEVRCTKAVIVCGEELVNYIEKKVDTDLEL